MDVHLVAVDRDGDVDPLPADVQDLRVGAPFEPDGQRAIRNMHAITRGGVLKPEFMFGIRDREGMPHQFLHAPMAA